MLDPSNGRHFSAYATELRVFVFATLTCEEADPAEEHNMVFDNRKYLIDNNWNTFCLPFDVEKSAFQHPDNMKIMALHSSSFANSKLTLEFIEADKTEAGTPCIVKWEGAILLEDTRESLPVFQSVKIKAPAPVDVESSYATFKGCYDAVEIAGEDKTMLYMGENSTLYYPNAAMTIGAFRAYFQLTGGLVCDEPQGINSYTLKFGNETTSIKETGNLLPQLPNSASSWFSLDGRQLSGKPTQKGIYIHNGKKNVIE